AVAPRWEVGDHGRIRTATGQALDLPPLPRLGYVVRMIPSCGLARPDSGVRTRHAALTPRRAWSEWRDSNPHLKAWKARRQPLPHIRSGPTCCDRPAADRWRSPAIRHPSVVKDPALASWCDTWRQCQDSNLDPRAL